MRWGGEEETPETCHSRADVLAWYRRLREAGVSASVAEVLDRGDVVVLGLALTAPQSGRFSGLPPIVFQVFRLTGGKVVDIRGFPERDQALAAVSD